MANGFREGRWDADSAAKRNAASAPAETVRITQQFRERHNMTYEIDCKGIPLVIRVFFPADDAPGSHWRIEASAGQTQPVSFASASNSSRAQALEHIAKSWRETMPMGVSNLDWNGIAQAMTSVRAI